MKQTQTYSVTTYDNNFLSNTISDEEAAKKANSLSVHDQLPSSANIELSLHSPFDQDERNSQSIEHTRKESEPNKSEIEDENREHSSLFNIQARKENTSTQKRKKTRQGLFGRRRPRYEKRNKSEHVEHNTPSPKKSDKNSISSLNIPIDKSCFGF